MQKEEEAHEATADDRDVASTADQTQAPSAKTSAVTPRAVRVLPRRDRIASECSEYSAASNELQYRTTPSRTSPLPRRFQKNLSQPSTVTGKSPEAFSIATVNGMTIMSSPKTLRRRRQNSRAVLPPDYEEHEHTHRIRTTLSSLLLAKDRRDGLRHVILIAIVFLYTLGGGALFLAIEAPEEAKSTAETIAALERTMRQLERDLRHQLKQNNLNESMLPRLRHAYVEMLQLEGKFEFSAFDRAAGHSMWTLGSACFFAATVYTTIGFGAIAPSTELAKAAALVYGVVFCPLTVVAVRDLGQFVLVHLTRLYARLLIKLRAARGYETTDTEAISLPIKFCSLVTISYVLAAAVFVHNYDAFWGPSALSLFDSLYFAFISITTIGLGDIMPSNVPFSPVIMTVFLFGLPIMRVVNRVNYVALENGVFGLFAIIDHALISKTAPLTDVSDATKPPSAPTIAKTAPVAVQPTATAVGDVEVGSDYSDEEDDYEEEEEVAAQELTTANTLTITRIADLMKSRADVYGGYYGRVRIRKTDLQ